MKNEDFPKGVSNAVFQISPEVTVKWGAYDNLVVKTEDHQGPQGTSILTAQEAIELGFFILEECPRDFDKERSEALVKIATKHINAATETND